MSNLLGEINHKTINKNKIIRLLSITSINQVFIGLACMLRNKKDNTEYLDYLIINNTMINDKAAASIIKAANYHNFEGVIDFRKQLRWCTNLKDNNETFPNILDLNKIRKLYNTIGQSRNINVIIKNLIELTSNNFIDEIYVRYKFNFPEIVLLSSFPFADIHTFEDGLGDYIPKINEKNINLINIVFLIKHKIINLISKLSPNNLHGINVLYRRVFWSIVKTATKNIKE